MSTRPSEVDSIVSSPGDPEGWHVREVTEEGYPLMGSSPAERAEAVQRAIRIKVEAMRGHPFEGDGAYCQAWSRSVRSGEWGLISMGVQCGFPVDMHYQRVR